MRVIYHSFRGHFSDSPRAIYEALARSGRDLEHLWIADPSHRHTFPHNVATVMYGSPDCINALEAADMLVSNDHLPLDWQKRPETTYLQTWHGTPLKRIHHDVRWAPAGRLEYLDTDIARWDHLLSPNRASTPRLREAFGFTGSIFETGYPRNDILHSPQRHQIGMAIRADLGVAESKTVVLYTPTWRDNLVFRTHGPGHELQLNLTDFVDKLGGDHVLLLRLHSMVADTLNLPSSASVIDCSAYPDVRDLYLAADVLVTDYSSTMFDFANTGKPILLFTYDLEYYRDVLRGFYFDLQEIAPGPMLTTSKEVISAIRDIKAWLPTYTARYETFRRIYCHLEDGHATDRVIKRFFPTDLASLVT